MKAEDIALKATYVALGATVAACGFLRGLIAWADWQTRTPGPSPRPPRHPMRKAR